MVTAIMESESFTWIAHGNTEEEAKEAILREWNRRQLKLRRTIPEWTPVIYKTMEDFEADYDIEIFDMAPGTCEFY